MAVQSPVDRQRLRQPRRPAAQPSVEVSGDSPTGTHDRKPIDRFESSQEHRAGDKFFRACHDVQAVMHAVDKVDVRVTNGAVHRCRPPRQPGAGMTGQIGRAAVCLGLDDPPNAELAIELAHNEGSEELARDVESWAREEAALQRSERSTVVRWVAFLLGPVIPTEVLAVMA